MFGLFGWLFGRSSNKGKSPKKPVEPERLRFVKALCERNPEVNKSPGQWSLGYMYTFCMIFPDGIKIEVEYNIVRREWDMEIWSANAGTFLYYYDCLDRKPYETIDYLIDRFGLQAKLNRAIAEKKARESKKNDQVAKIKAKYLGDQS
jgi:hypothetical protein